MAPLTGTLLIPRDIGVEWGRELTGELARQLETRLRQPVAVDDPEDAAVSVGARIQSLVDAECQRIVFVPLGLTPFREGAGHHPFMESVKTQWPAVSFHVAAPLTWVEWSRWLRSTAQDSINDLGISPAESAVLLVGRGSTDPLTNADLARLAHLVQEGTALDHVNYALLDSARPAISETIRALAALGHRQVVVVPWLLPDRNALRLLESELEASSRQNDLKTTLTKPSLAHPALINLIVSNHYAALSEDSSAGHSTPAPITPEEERELEELDRRISALLPPEYKGRYETVRPNSMGSASLKYDAEGRVAWDEIWTSFCDLALAGGPPHRGTLLEAVTAAEALAEPDQYQAVVTETERGIGLVSALPTVASRTPGWVGVRCDSEEMAVWLMRAIIVENVMVRREGDILYLPAGPRFTVKREIKNVVTTIAKTVHYWKAHLRAGG